MKRSNERRNRLPLEGLSVVVAASEEGGLHVSELSIMFEITQLSYKESLRNHAAQ